MGFKVVGNFPLISSLVIFLSAGSGFSHGLGLRELAGDEMIRGITNSGGQHSTRHGTCQGAMAKCGPLYFTPGKYPRKHPQKYPGKISPFFPPLNP